MAAKKNMNKDIQRNQQSAAVYGRGRVPIKGEIAPKLYFRGTPGKEPGMWWRFWSVWCGPYENGLYRVITGRCPTHLSIGKRFMQRRSIAKSAIRVFKRADHIRGSRPEDVKRWRETHKYEWSRIDKKLLGRRAKEWANKCR